MSLCASAWRTKSRWAWAAAHRLPGRLAAIALAVHFGKLGWTDEQDPRRGVRARRASRQCRGMLAGRICQRCHRGKKVHVARVTPPARLESDRGAAGRAAGNQQSAGRASRRVTSRADVIANLQSVSLLGLAFAQARGDLLRVAMSDRIHQPYRAAICPMLPRLLPLAGTRGHTRSGPQRCRAGRAGIVDGRRSACRRAAARRSARL